MREQLTRNTRIDCALDAKERPLHCHHEKTIVIDDRLAFVGGIDLTSKAGDRYDTSDHVARASVGWHDACALIAGPAVQDVAEHFRLRWQEVRGESLPAPKPCEPAGEVELQVVRTVPEKIYRRLPRGDFSILESYQRALRAAQRLIYLENQFLWSPEIAAVLADKLRHPPDPDFRLLLVLPAKPNSGADDTRGVLGELIEADDDNGRLLACTLYARSGALADPIYVHAKIAVIDDRWLTIGSANLNEHSLFNDTEMNLVTHDPANRHRRPAPTLVRTPRTAGRRHPGGHDEGDRRDLETTQRRTTPTPQPGTAPHPPPRPAAERLPPLRPGPRPPQRPARRRLNAQIPNREQELHRDPTLR